MNVSFLAIFVAAVFAAPAPAIEKAISTKPMAKGDWPWGGKAVQAPVVVEAKSLNACPECPIIVPIAGCGGPLWNGQFPWMICSGSKPVPCPP